jgi:vacuolar-type H+-ATPase subunit E/Vma4
MNNTDIEQTTTHTLEYLLGVVMENREQRCTDIRQRARAQADDMIKQAHTRVRSRVTHHVMMLRDKYRERISAAEAHSQTLIRQQHQAEDKQCLESAWPILREALRTSWSAPESRSQWLDAAIAAASSSLLQHEWRIEHPADFTVAEQQLLSHHLAASGEVKAMLSTTEDIEAGIRIRVDFTVIDATLDGLLQQEAVIKARLIARIKQEISNHD